MNFGPLDWIIVIIYLIATVVAGLWMRRYLGNVGDYIVAGRAMDTYLGVASLAATELGIVTVMYTAELGYKNGFAGMVPGILFCLAAFFLGITGFIIEPLREAGVMTIPELFQTRYSMKVRWLAGVFIALGGILNMGIFLKLGGQFLVYCVGMPENYLEIVMISLLALTLVYTVAGGMLSVLITDYLQFILLGLGIVVTSAFVLHANGWTALADAVRRYHGDAGFTPLLGEGQGGGWLFWQALTAFGAISTWQTTIARVLAAKDAKTGRKIYTTVAFYYVGRFGLPGLWAIGALAVLGDKYLQPGMDSLAAMPIYIGTILPTGILGLVVAGMLAAEMSTDSAYLLTWASVIYNDITRPLIKRPLRPTTEIWITRSLVIALGVFLVFFGLLYPLKGAAWDYLAITGNIYLASILTLLVAALYFPKASTGGAFTALVCGAAGPITFLALGLIFKDFALPPWVPGIGAFALAALGMIVGSILWPNRTVAKGDAA